jgi:hypothetical protein
MKTEVEYLIHKIPPPVSILSHMNSIHTQNQISLRSTFILSFNLFRGYLEISFLYYFQTKFVRISHFSFLPACLMFRHHILLDLIIITEPSGSIRWAPSYVGLSANGEEYKLWSPSMCIFLHLLVTSPLLGPNILPSILLSNTFSLCFSFKARDNTSHLYDRKYYSFVYFNL